MKLKHFIMMLDDFVEDGMRNNDMHIEIIDKNGVMNRIKGIDIDTELGENEEEVVKIEFWTEEG